MTGTVCSASGAKLVLLCFSLTMRGDVSDLKVNFECHTSCCAYLTMEKKANEDKREQIGLAPNKLAIRCIKSTNSIIPLLVRI